MSKQDSSIHAAAVRRASAPSARPAEIPEKSILVKIGDFFRMIFSAAEYVIELIEHAIEKVWYFVVQIGEAIYHAILDTVEAIVAGVEWIFKQIEIGIEKIIKFVEFVFDWGDITRSKDVVKSLFIGYTQYVIEGVVELKSTFDEKMDIAQRDVAKWAGLKDWDLGSDLHKPAVEGPPPDVHAGSDHMMHHLENNYSSITTVSDGAGEESKTLIQNVLNVIRNEEKVLEKVGKQFKDLSADFESLSTMDVIKRVLGIIANGVLGSTKVVVDALFDVFVDIVKDVVKLLDTKIHIPVISDILSAIGIPEISFLDLVCWIGAAVYTVGYKIAHGKAPFDSSVDVLKTHWKEQSQPHVAAHSLQPAALRALPPTPGFFPWIPYHVQGPLFSAAFGIGGCCTLIAGWLDPFAVLGNPLSSKLLMAARVLSAALPVMATVVSPRAPLTPPMLRYAFIGLSGVRGIAVIYFAAVEPARVKEAAIVDLFFGFFEMVGCIWHLDQLSSREPDDERLAARLIESTNIIEIVKRFFVFNYAIEPPLSPEWLVSMGLSMLCNVGMFSLQIFIATIPQNEILETKPKPELPKL